MKLAESNKPPGTHIFLSRIFHTGDLRSGQSRDLTGYKPIEGYWNCSFWTINNIIRTRTDKYFCHALLACLPTLFLHCWHCATSQMMSQGSFWVIRFVNNIRYTNRPPLAVRQGHWPPPVVRRGHWSPLVVWRCHWPPPVLRRGHWWWGGVMK